MELACKSYAQNILLLNFKIIQKAFGFKPNFSNKSSRIYSKDSNKTGLIFFWIFYKFLQISKDHWFWIEGRDWNLAVRLSGRFKSMQLGPWFLGTERLKLASQIPMTVFAGGEGEPTRNV
jgi:hypothetical protein